MISFDYLHSARPDIIVRILEFRIPSRLQSAIAALAGSIVIAGGAWGIESYRLSAALTVETTYQANYERSETALARENVYFDRVKNLVALDKRLRDITASGNVTARRLAQIGNALPQKAWLSSISRDGDGLLLEGGASDMASVGRVLSALTNAHGISNPTLVDASADSRADGTVKFTVHADGAIP